MQINECLRTSWLLTTSPGVAAGGSSSFFVFEGAFLLRSWDVDPAMASCERYQILWEGKGQIRSMFQLFFSNDPSISDLWPCRGSTAVLGRATHRCSFWRYVWSKRPLARPLESLQAQHARGLWHWRREPATFLWPEIRDLLLEGTPFGCGCQRGV